MNTFRILSIAAAMALVVGMSHADDELGKKPKPKPPTQGGGGGPETKPPPQTKPPESKPPQSKPPESKPPESKPPQTKPPENKPPQNKPPESKPPQNRPPENKPPTSGGGDDGGLGKKPRPGQGSGSGNGGGSGSGGSGNGNGGSGNGNGNGNNRPPIIIGGGNQGNGGNSGGNRGDDKLGRIDNSNQGRPGQGNDSDLGKSNRRDRVYNTVNNSNRGERNSSPGRIGNAPIDVIAGSLKNQVLREDNPRARHPSPDYRRGYYSYHNGWCDDDFWYSHYVFTPTVNCYVSPWYYYNHLPGYLQVNNIIVLSGNQNYNWRGSYYNYRPYYNNSGSWFNDNRSDLDYAVDDIVSMFERQDRRALSRLLPRRGNIDIYFDQRYSYSLDSDEFYDLMLDGIMTTRTRRYEVVRVERNRDEVEVQARHQYVDPWGRSESVFHWYRLKWERDGYVITKFGTTNRSAW
ncbi:MAG: hypothetical protein KF784_10335 [Fimbriimonadaceae bacterium]|nr:hypothetical protein [Fimbriimonadaceae bacterium]